MIAAKLRDVRVSPSPERIGELICLIVFFLSYWPTLLAGTVASDGRFPEILETGNRRRHNRVFFFFLEKLDTELNSGSTVSSGLAVC